MDVWEVHFSDGLEEKLDNIINNILFLRDSNLKALSVVESCIIQNVVKFTEDYRKLFHQAWLFKGYFKDFAQLLT